MLLMIRSEAKKKKTLQQSRNELENPGKRTQRIAGAGASETSTVNLGSCLPTHPGFSLAAAKMLYLQAMHRNTLWALQPE